MTPKKKKTLAAVVAVALAVVIALGGTFAWQSISQTARNEAAATVNPGGRLHDDFDGSNKDVYVENFTGETDGTPIFARVRLDEYMEIGNGAGTDRNLSSDSELTTTGLTVVGQGAKINDKTTWTTRTPNGGLANEDGEVYWAWDTEGGQTVYMPTFHKNKDSLQADINGTYDGKTDTDVPYDDYVTYTEGQQVTADATYDNDNNDIEDEGIRTESETHTAKTTINGTVITMDEWLDRWEAYQTAVESGTPAEQAADDTQVMGDFWVWDDDGWAYWANAIAPDTATGLLLEVSAQERLKADFAAHRTLAGYRGDGKPITSDDRVRQQQEWAMHVDSAGAAGDSSGLAPMLAIRSWIMANAFDDITVAKVAARFHYSPSYLTAMYRRVFGVGVAEQIIEYRIDRARELLSSTASSVADIAREVGYADPKYFMRVFKRRTGLTPGQYRDAFPARLYNTV